MPVGSGDLLGVMGVFYPNIKRLLLNTDESITVVDFLRSAASPRQTETETGRHALKQLLCLIEWHLAAINSGNHPHCK